MNSALVKLRLLCTMLCAAAVCCSQETVAQEGAIAKLNAAITPQGALQGTLEVTIAGAGSLPYREAFRQGSAQTASATLFGRFTQARQLISTPTVTDLNTQERPIKINFHIAENDFILPVQRQASLQIHLVPLVSPAAPQPNGNLSPGLPGTFAKRSRWRFLKISP